MKDYIINNVDLDNINKVLEYLNNKGVEIECYEGCLLDNYIIEDAKIGLNKAQPRKHIIIKEVALNEWSSTSTIIMTNNDEKIEEFRKVFEDDIKIAN